MCFGSGGGDGTTLLVFGWSTLGGAAVFSGGLMLSSDNTLGGVAWLLCLFCFVGIKLL